MITRKSILQEMSEFRQKQSILGQVVNNPLETAMFIESSFNITLNDEEIKTLNDLAEIAIASLILIKTGNI